MALSFQNQGIATAKIGLAGGEGKVYSMAGVNGELLNADQFALAIEQMFDIVGWQPAYDSEEGYGDMRRITTQKVAGVKE